jgi:hypothetical protein
MKATEALSSGLVLKLVVVITSMTNSVLTLSSGVEIHSPEVNSGSPLNSNEDLIFNKKGSNAEPFLFVVSQD